MTIEQLCTLFNLAGILVPVAFSLGVAMFYEEVYFRLWTIGYALAFLSIAMEMVAGRLGHPMPITLLEVAAYLASGLFCARMADDLVGRKVRFGPIGWLAVAIFVQFLGSSVAGVPFERAVIFTILYYIATQLVLGVQMWRGPGQQSVYMRLIGAGVIVTGLWVLAFPALIHSAYFWVGYATAGMLHLVLGMAMMLYLFADIASRLRRHNEELQVVERLQAEFIGVMSHEFRTPLNAIKTAAFLLASVDAERLTDKQLEVVGIINHNVDRFIGLVGDVLDYSKLESGSMSFDFVPTELGHVVAYATRAHLHQFAEKGIELELKLPDEPVSAEVDDRRIGQVVTNLLSNALKFTPAGGRVEVALSCKGADAWLEVRDNGVGIPAELRERVFTKFYQADATNTRRAGGAGLGLSICRAIVEDGHGGRIWVEDNRPGCTFCVRLPLERLIPAGEAVLTLPPSVPLLSGASTSEIRREP